MGENDTKTGHFIVANVVYIEMCCIQCSEISFKN
jgi:hypothetical protein